MVNASTKRALRLPAWKSVQLGLAKSLPDLRCRLRQVNCGIGEYGNEILRSRKFAIATKPTRVRLTLVRVCDLGFSAHTSYADIRARAGEFGLNECPAEVGPVLRLEYLDQEVGDVLHVGMEAIARPRTYHQFLFILKHGADARRQQCTGSRLWLDGRLGNWAGAFWPNDRFVFALP
ncbi:MAG TPA: hypothetical protein VKY24_18030 [Reyranella sp.]|nr:hypothetical protein [Reyranella sp.]